MSTKPLKDYTVKDIEALEKIEPTTIKEATPKYFYTDDLNVKQPLEVLGRCLHLPRFILATRLSDNKGIALHDTRLQINK